MTLSSDKTCIKCGVSMGTNSFNKKCRFCRTLTDPSQGEGED